MGMVLTARRLTADEARLDPEELADLLLEGEDEDARTVDLDKAWHAVHFLLTGTEWEVVGEAGQAVLGGEPVGEDLGTGPLRVVAAADVVTTSLALAALDEQELRGRYDPARMRELQIYPDVWDEEDVLDEYVLPAFRDLAGLYARAAAEQQAVVLLIS